MPDRPHNSKSKLISEEAADWLVCLREGSLEESERQQYVRWLKQSPAHVAEMLEVASLDGLLRDSDLEGLLPSPDDTAAQEASNVVELIPREASEELSLEVERPWMSHHWRLVASVSVLAVALLFGTVAKLAWFDKIIETEAGEWRHFMLADGSIARVGPRSRLRLDFSEYRRSIYLSRGEAVFQVAKDPARPFLVNAEYAVVRAVGTEFGVSRHRDAVVVTVAEGRVAVSQAIRPVVWNGERELPKPHPIDVDDELEKRVLKNDEESIAVSAGEQVSVSRKKPMTVQHVDPIRELAWAQGKLIFNNDTTLAQAIEQFNRRNRMQIQVDDSELADSLVCCIFSADDPESFALSVATKPNVSLVREGADRLRLVAAADQSEGLIAPLPPKE